MNIAINLAGWAGSLLLVLAYWLVGKSRLKPQSVPYHLLNVSGSLLLIINTAYYGAYPSTAVNVVWIAIGGFYLVKGKRYAN